MRPSYIIGVLFITAFLNSCIPTYSCSCDVYNIDGGDTLSHSRQYRKVGQKTNYSKAQRLCNEFEAELVYIHKPEKGELDVDCMIYAAK